MRAHNPCDAIAKAFAWIADSLSLFGFIFDGVNPVEGLFSTRDTLLLIGIRFVDPTTGKLSSRLLAASPCGLRKSGHDLSFLVKRSDQGQAVES